MRRIIVGKDADGRSSVVEVGEVTANPISGALRLGATQLYGILQSPPPACDPGTSHYGPEGLQPGHVSMVLIEHGPYDPATEQAPTKELHWRNATDMVLILDGGGNMLLGDGEFPLGPGDLIIMPGSDHKFLPGPQGARLIDFSIGTPPA
jgi:hypothetical protein